MKLDLKHFQGKLEAEKKVLVDELSHLGFLSNPAADEWEATPVLEDMATSEADENDRADRSEDFEERTAMVKELGARLRSVDRALEKIQKGKYGVCEIGGEEIEIKRLEANASAETCIKHME